MKKFKNYFLSLTILLSSCFALGMHKSVWFATGLANGNIIINELQKDGTYKVIKKVDRNSDNAHTGWVNALVYDSKKDLLFSESFDKTIKVWHVVDGKPFDSAQERPFDIAPTRDRLKHLQTIDRNSDSNAHTDYVNALAYDSEQRLLFSSSDDKTIKVWHMIDGTLKHLQTIKDAHTDYIRALAYDSTKDLLFSGSYDKTIKVWHVVDGSLEHLQTIKNAHTDWVNVLAYNSKKGLLFSGSWDKTIKVWHVVDDTLKHLQTIKDAHTDCIRALVYDNNQGFLFSGSLDKTIKVWHMIDGTLKHLQTIEDAHIRCVNALTYDSNKSLLFSCSDDKTIKVCHMVDGSLEHLQTIDIQSSVRSLVILDDNKQKEIAQQDLKERIGFLANNLEYLCPKESLLHQKIKKINIVDRFNKKITTLLVTLTLLFN